MFKIKRLAAVATALILIVLTAAACGDNEPVEEPIVTTLPVLESPSPSPSPEESPSPEPVETPPPTLNPLTGLPIAKSMLDRRPVAIVYNNRSVAQPMLGVEKSDIIIEAPVEGGYTRILALFQDITGAGEICSIRSARPYFVDFAQSFDAVFIHAGGSPDAYSVLKSRDIDNLDGVNGSKTDIFYRDDERRRSSGLEHSLASSDALVNKWLPTYGMRLDHDSGYNQYLTFLDNETIALKIAENTASRVSIEFSGAKTTSFTYDSTAGLYTMMQHGGVFKDGNTGNPVTFANIIIINTRISTVRNDTQGRLEINTLGAGTGKLLVGGVWRDINWSRESQSSPYRFTYQSGADVTLRSGRTYIGITNNSMNITIGEGG